MVSDAQLKIGLNRTFHVARIIEQIARMTNPAMKYPMILPPLLLGCNNLIIAYFLFYVNFLLYFYCILFGVIITLYPLSFNESTTIWNEFQQDFGFIPTPCAYCLNNIKTWLQYTSLILYSIKKDLVNLIKSLFSFIFRKKITTFNYLKIVMLVWLG